MHTKKCFFIFFIFLSVAVAGLLQYHSLSPKMLLACLYPQGNGIARTLRTITEVTAEDIGILLTGHGTKLPRRTQQTSFGIK